MILCIDVGNSQIYIGAFKDDKLLAQVRYDSRSSISSDQLGIFLKAALAEKGLDYKAISHITICSVVPEIDYSMRAACIKYLEQEPFFLGVGAKTGLQLKSNNPAEIGADRIATAIGGNDLYPNQNLIVVDMGTATTVCAVTKNKEYLPGAILAGIKSSVKALASDTAKLPSVEIVKPQSQLGRSTKENIQIGLFYGHLGAVKEIISYLSKHAFAKDDYLVLGTGGLSGLYRDEKLFNDIIPELVLIGLNKLCKLNAKAL
jgi:type III pantothenate kinase